MGKEDTTMIQILKKTVPCCFCRAPAAGNETGKRSDTRTPAIHWYCSGYGELFR
jgi:hypothetical protein